ncbi:manganese efflux pump MntP [Paenibacillus xylaniclasticus]|uniref:manganese efflux pump MntP n=1 Tax=Paenibacillus xylaniclasticus TaxID=588083 RepID=UPI000FDC69DD|nr:MULTISPECIES: manganese efflux pump MntP family protein [Paenibacillus]GFN32729.1 putative manganese efflux pump MntP [Paenibacillus curdlanolyticus]
MLLESGMGTGQLLTLLIMAAALGMDAFSLGVGIGMRGIRLKRILALSSIIALFHVLMPLAGMYAGQYVSGLLGTVASRAAGVLLLLLGGHMVYNSFRAGSNEQTVDHQTFWGMLLFAFSVSVDSFSVGVSLGMFAVNILLAVLLFGLFGGVMSVLGLMLGRHAGRSLGDYGEACGGIILLTFGLIFVF